MCKTCNLNGDSGAYAKGIRMGTTGVGSDGDADFFSNNSMVAWVKEMKEFLGESFMRFVVTLWMLWNKRNAVLF